MQSQPVCILIVASVQSVIQRLVALRSHADKADLAAYEVTYTVREWTYEGLGKEAIRDALAS